MIAASIALKQITVLPAPVGATRIVERRVLSLSMAECWLGVSDILDDIIYLFLVVHYVDRYSNVFKFLDLADLDFG